MHRRVPAALGLLLAAASGSALAESDLFAPLPQLQVPENDLALRADIQHTDNALRRPRDERGDTIASVGLGGDYTRDGTKLDVAATANLDWVKYFDNSFESSAVGFATARALWGSPNDLFQFAATDSFGQQRTDPLSAPTHQTTENVNSLAAGPAFNFLFSQTTRLTLYGLYRLTDYQTSPFSSDSEEGGVALVHALSAASFVSLNGETNHVNYDDAQAPDDYQVDNGYVRFQTASGRTVLAADVGYTHAKQGADSGGGVLARLLLGRRVSSTSVLSVSAQQRFNAAYEVLDASRRVVDASDRIDGGISRASPYRERSGRVEWRTTHPRTTFIVGGYWREEDYLRSSLFDTKYSGGDATVSRNFRPTVIGRLSAGYSKEKFPQLGASFSDVFCGADLEKVIGRRFVASLRYERYRRNGDVTREGEFTENRYGLRVSYRFIGT